MKRIISFILMLTPYLLLAQEKKPTIMILPSDNWCVARYYTTTYQDDGRTVRVSDYRRAFQEDPEIGQVISQVGQMMTDLGYEIKDAEHEIINIEQREIEDQFTNSTGGSGIYESVLDIIKRKLRADIIIQIDWNVSKQGISPSISTSLGAFDAYTSKRIATSAQVSSYNGDLIISIVNGFKSGMPTFDNQLSGYFNSLREKGREIILTVRRWNSWSYDLESVFNGKEVLEIIQEWLRSNTVCGNYNLSDATENFALFEQVRIPLVDENNNALDARSFASQLRKYLRNPPYGIQSKLLIRGLGEAILVLGEQ